MYICIINCIMSLLRPQAPEIRLPVLGQQLAEFSGHDEETVALHGRIADRRELQQVVEERHEDSGGAEKLPLAAVGNTCLQMLMQHAQYRGTELVPPTRHRSEQFK